MEMVKKLTIKQACRDLANEFLCEIVKKGNWKSQEINNEFHRALYALSLYYLGNEDEREEERR